MLSKQFSPYPSYRNSGVEWLGHIPTHWNAKRLKFVANARGSKLDTKPADSTYVGLENIESWTGQLFLDNQPDQVDSVVTEFKAGDVLFGKLRPYLAKAARPDFDGVCTSEILPLRPLGDYSQSYGMYTLLESSLIRWINSFTYGTKMPRISPEQLGTQFVPVPLLPEQHLIAAFLDRETAKIDELVAKKKRLIDLLHEKRAALITHAVTKGLSAAPMKETGLEWLERIPAHWGLSRLKNVSSFVTSGSRGWAEHYVDDGDIFLRIGNLKNGSVDLDFSDVQHVIPPRDAESRRTQVRAGDVVLSITALIGAVGVVPDGIPNAFVNQHLALVRLSAGGILSRWLGYYVLSRLGQEQFSAALYGGTKDALNLEDVSSLVLLKPPIDEQRRIVDILDRESRRTDALVEAVKVAIERLREFRAALISAAVTGTIDVRDC